MEYFFCRTNLLLETFKAKFLTMRSKFEQTICSTKIFELLMKLQKYSNCSTRHFSKSTLFSHFFDYDNFRTFNPRPLNFIFISFANVMDVSDKDDVVWKPNPIFS